METVKLNPLQSDLLAAVKIYQKESKCTVTPTILANIHPGLALYTIQRGLRFLFEKGLLARSRPTKRGQFEYRLKA